MRRALVVAAAVAIAAAPNAVRAQATNRVDISLFAGAGVTRSLSQPRVDRGAGPTFVGGIEFARPSLSGLLGRTALRAEGGFAWQDFNIDQGIVRGNVQTVHAALALQIGLLDGGARRVAPYALGGAVWGRPSTRFELKHDAQTTPGASFAQVDHENVLGALVGAGVAWQTSRAVVRAEARWMPLRTAERTTSTLPLMVTVAFPVRR